MLMNFCEIKHDGQHEPLTDQKLVKQQYFSVISTFFPSFVLLIFTWNLTTLFPGNFTSVLYYVRLIYLLQSNFIPLELFSKSFSPHLIFFFFGTVSLLKVYYCSLFSQCYCYTSPYFLGFCDCLTSSHLFLLLPLSHLCHCIDSGFCPRFH